MKHIIPIAALAVFIALDCPALAGSGTCQEKEQAIMRQLDIARHYNNRGKIRGLERALANVRTWCSDDGLLTKAQDNIEQKQKKVREREQELAEAKAEGKGSDKIAKRARKLEEARNELLEAVQKRDALLNSLDHTED